MEKRTLSKVAMAELPSKVLETTKTVLATTGVPDAQKYLATQGYEVPRSTLYAAKVNLTNVALQQRAEIDHEAINSIAEAYKEGADAVLEAIVILTCKRLAELREKEAKLHAIGKYDRSLTRAITDCTQALDRLLTQTR